MSAVGSDRVVRAPRGTQLSCKGWQQEAALRMLMNNLDPEVAERPQDLVVYGGAGKAARSWAAFDAIVAALRRLNDDETLLVQSGKPVGVFQTHEWAPRVLIANANLVGDWDNWDEFRRLDALGLTMYGQMTAGSWIYIGTQGILQGTYQTFAAAGEKHYGSDLAGRLVLTAGLGGMGGAQPLAVTMAGGVALCVEVDPRAHRAAPGDRLPGLLDRVARRGPALRGGGRQRQAAAVDRPAGQRRRCLSRARAPRRHPRPGDRPDLGPRHPERLCAQRHELRRGARAAPQPTPASTCVAPWPRSSCTSRPWWPCRRPARTSSTTATTSAARRRPPAMPTPLPSRALCRSTSGRCSAVATVPSAGRRCRAMRPTSRAPTGPCSRPSPTTRWSPAGSAWPPRRCTSRACPAASAGSSTASAPRWARSSTSSWPAARSRRRW